LANALTILRLLMIPVFIYALGYAEGDGSTLAAVLFAVASLTDWLDGQVARRTGTVSEFGRFADPLADRLLVGSALVILLVRHALPASGVMIVLVRDALLMAGYWVLARRKLYVPVTLLGKVSTTALMIALFFAILGVSWAPALFWIAVALSLGSGAVYVSRGLRQFFRPRPGVGRQAGGFLGERVTEEGGRR